MARHPGAGSSGREVERTKLELAVYKSTYFMAPHTPEIHAEVLVPGLHGFDELIYSYEDRGCTLTAEHADAIVLGANGMFISTIVAAIDARPFGKLPKGFARAAAAYGAFVGKPIRVTAQGVSSASIAARWALSG